MPIMFTVRISAFESSLGCEPLLPQIGSVLSEKAWESCLHPFHHCEWITYFSDAVIEHRDQKQHEEERVSFSLPSRVTVHHQGNSGKSEAEVETVQECILLACLLCFLKHPRPTFSGAPLPSMVWALPRQPSLKRMPCRLAYRPVT